MKIDASARLNGIIADLCLNKPIYFSIPDPTEGDERELKEFLANETIKFDSYCIHCRLVTPFRAFTPHGSVKSISTRVTPRQRSSRYFGSGLVYLNVQCQRESGHSYSYIFSHVGEQIQKIGQIPTYEDIASADLVAYRNVLDDLDFSELRKAGGLFSHDISVGAFVYLRRIFERMIQRHYQSYIAQAGPISRWKSMPMDKRIQAISEFLPATLVENRKIYSILSAAVHELQESQCQRYFPVIRAGIIAILEEDIQRRAKVKAAEDLRKAVGSIVAEIKKPDSNEPTS